MISTEIKERVLANIKMVPETNLAKHLLDDEISWNEMQDTQNFIHPKQQEVIKEAYNLVKERRTVVDYEKFLHLFSERHFNNQHVSQARNELEKMKEDQREDLFWRECSGSNDISKISDYLSKCDQNLFKGKYRSTAQNLIVTIIQGQQNQKKQQYLNKLKENPNAYSIEQLRAFGINDEDLISVGIPQDIVNILDHPGIQLQIGDTPGSIPSGVTEVYFWGNVGSGKTCALASILSYAQKKGLMNPQEGEGRLYMSQLSNMFNNSVATLPPGTKVETTQYLPFWLLDNQNKPHPIALIEISGEIFSCFSKIINGQPLPSDAHERTYKTLLNFLSSTENPKLHFFVVDISKTGIINELGLTQQNLLQDCASYFNTNKIFNTKTAGISIVTTKSDLLSPDEKERLGLAKDHLNEYYRSFVNSLKAMAKDLRLITDGIQVIPFTLGEVYLKEKCKYDPKMAKHIVSILQDNTNKLDNGRSLFGWLNK